MIVDVYGNKINESDISEIQTSQSLIGYLRREIADHPSRNLTPAKLSEILDEAEEGNIIRQCELADDMVERDGHIYAELSKRQRAALSIDWDIMPPKNASVREKRNAQKLKEIIGNIPDFEDVLLNLGDAILKGFSCIEIATAKGESGWQKVGNEYHIIGTQHRPSTWFTIPIENRNEIRLRDQESSDGIELQPFGWIPHIHKSKAGYIARAGLVRPLSSPYIAKNYGVNYLLKFLEIYGIPIRIGKYHSKASEEEKMRLLRAVTEMGHNAAGIISEMMNVSLLESAKGSSDGFQFVIDWAERSASKIILGGTLTTQADGKTSTNALGTIHQDVMWDIIISDCRQYASTLSRYLVYPLATLNFGDGHGYQFKFDTTWSDDLALLSDAIPKLVDIGAKIGQSYIYNSLKIPRPDDGEEILQRGNSQSQPIQEPTPTSVKTAAARLQQQEDDELDGLADLMSSDWKRQMSPIITPFVELARQCQSFEEFEKRLNEAVVNSDTANFEEMMANGLFMTYIYGQLTDGR